MVTPTNTAVYDARAVSVNLCTVHNRSLFSVFWPLFHELSLGLVKMFFPYSSFLPHFREKKKGDLKKIQQKKQNYNIKTYVMNIIWKT